MWAWHCHHEILVERVINTMEECRRYIKLFKPPKEKDLRLKLFKRVKGKLPKKLLEIRTSPNWAYRLFLPEINKLHEKECPDCPWDGETIFPKKHK